MAVSFKKEAPIIYDADDLWCYTGYYDTENNYAYIDTETKGEHWAKGGAFTIATLQVQQEGIYTIHVEYETDTNENLLSVMPVPQKYGEVAGNDATLFANKKSATYKVWLKDTDVSYQIFTTYCGEGYMKVYNVSVEESGTTLTTRLASWVCVFVLFNMILYMVLNREKYVYLKAETKVVAFIMALTVFAASYPLLTNYLTDGHDLYFHLLRIEEIKDGLKAGHFPVKMHVTALNGYGYPTSIFYGDILLYVPALIRLIGFPLQLCYKIYVLMVNILTAVVAFWCFSRMVGDKKVAVIGSALYTLAYYRMINIYVRGAVGEYSAMIFLPLVIYGLYQIFTLEDKESLKRAWIPAALGYTGLIQTHLLSGEMVGVFTIFSCLLLIKKVFEKERFMTLCKTVVAMLLINIGFLLPMFDSMRQDMNVSGNVSDSTYSLQNHGTFWAQLFQVFHTNEGKSADALYGIKDDMPMALGGALILGIVIFLYYTFIKSVEVQKNRLVNLGIVGCILMVIALFMSSTAFPYDKLMQINHIFSILIGNIQYPWRFITIATMLASVVTCIGLWLSQKSGDFKIVAMLLLVFTMISNNYLLDMVMNTEPARYIYDVEQMGTFQIGGSDYLLSGVDLQRLEEKRVIVGQDVSVFEYQKSYDEISVKCNNAGNDSYLEVPLLNYKGYVAQCVETREEIRIVDGETRVIRLCIPEGFGGTIEVQWKEPILWRISEIISFLSIVCLGIICFKSKRQIR